LVGVGTCFVEFAGGRESGREVDAECCFGADERGLQPVEGIGEDGGGVGVVEAGEGVAAPAGGVDSVEGDVGAFVAGVSGRELGGEGPAVCGGEP
jgi:hypothetical protein